MIELKYDVPSFDVVTQPGPLSLGETIDIGAGGFLLSDTLLDDVIISL